MREYVTDAIVLKRDSSGEYDERVCLYTKQYGGLDVRVIGSRKPLSKFSPHLDVLNLVTIRMVRKNSYTLTDAYTTDRFVPLRHKSAGLGKALELVALLALLVPREQPDTRLWHTLLRAFRESVISNGTFLTILGYNPRHAKCDACGNERVAYFFTPQHSFACEVCGSGVRESDRIALTHAA